MLVFVLSRLSQGAAALFVLSAVAFSMSHATGDPRDLLLPPTTPVEQYEAVGKALGLDEPLVVQYGIFMQDALKGDLGRSLRSGDPVTSLLIDRLAASAQLAGAAILLTIAAGVPLGVISAVNRGSGLDSLAKAIALLGQSLPSFWVGIMLIQIFAVWLRLLPSGTNQGPLHLILPAVTLALFGIAGIARLLRSSMLEVLDTDFVKMARIKGLPERTVIWKHAIRNALLPVISFAGVFFVNLLTIAIVAETVFAWPGLGLLTYTAILNRDFPVIQGVVLVAGAIAILVSTLADVAYTYLDPRIET